MEQWRRTRIITFRPKIGGAHCYADGTYARARVKKKQERWGAKEQSGRGRFQHKSQVRLAQQLGIEGPEAVKPSRSPRVSLLCLESAWIRTLFAADFFGLLGIAMGQRLADESFLKGGVVTVQGLGPGDCPTRPVVDCQLTPPWQLRPTNPTTYLREFHSLRILFFFFLFSSLALN